MIHTETRKEIRHIIDRIRDGEKEAFRILIERYQPLVIHIVFRLVSRDEDREDICQDVFIRVYENLGGFRYRSKMSTWIARIAYNRCINYLEKKKVPLLEDKMPECTFDDIPAGDENPLSLLEMNDLSFRIHAELEKLSIPFRTILTLYHLEDMSYEEIGHIMNLPEGTVKNHLFRARKQLKNLLLKEYMREEI